MLTRKWMLFNVSSCPGNQERLLQDLVDYGVTNEVEWTADLTNSLPFMGIMTKEVQRLHNPSYELGRTALANLIIPGRYRIPKDSLMTIGSYYIHNNPKVWNDLAKFDPDRWNTDKVKNRHKAAYVPFAAGPRQYIDINLRRLDMIPSSMIRLSSSSDQ